ncbi:MAG: hypothetical protein V2A79_08165 [Planctomycetota bacterium]
MRASRTNLITRCWLAAATLLAGGTVLSTCELRVRDAFVSSTKSTVLGLFDTMLQDLAGDVTTDGNGQSTTP